MELRVVGSGSDGNCYLLKDGNQYLALDAGIKFQSVQVACDFEVGKIVGLLATHAHLDHIKYVPVFKQNAVDCYTGVGACQTIAKATGVIPNVLKERRWNFIGDWQILCFEVPHEDEPCYGYIIESPSGHKLMYLTDFQYSRYTFRTKHLNTMLIACNHLDDIEEHAGGSAHFAHVVRGHSSLTVTKNCIRVNQTNDLRHVILCHISKDNGDPERMQKEIQETVGNKVTVDIATKGLKVDL